MSCKKLSFAVLSLVVLFGLPGCFSPGKGSIKAGEVTVRGVADAGKPASLNTSTAGERLPLPAGSKITKTETPAQPATATAPAEPAKTVTVVEPAGPTEWTKTAETVSADTGTIDTSVSKHRIDVAERRWLLFTAIGCALGGLVLKSMLPAWPGLSNGLLFGAVLAGASWKLSEVPSWLWAIALSIAAILAMGYKRAQWDQNGDGIPDVLQK